MFKVDKKRANELAKRDYTQNYNSISFGEKGSVPIDQSPAQDFNIDPATGRPVSDISKLVRAQNKMELNKALNDIEEFKAATGLPDEITDEQALDYVNPRLCQLPSERFALVEEMTQAKLDKAEKERAAKLDALRRQSEDALLEELDEEKRKKSDQEEVFNNV